MPLTLKEKLNHKEPVLGSWISFTDPTCTEILCNAGFDFCIIDAEHSPLGIETLRDLVLAAKGSQTSLIVRVPSHDAGRVKTMLDLGADGIMFPMVNTAEQARDAVRSCKYPPDGIRGIGPWRPSRYYEDTWGYVMRANRETVVMLQIESIGAVEALDEIVQVPGIDVIFIGPADLTASLNRLPNTKHPDVLAAFDRVAESCRKVDMTFGCDGESRIPLMRDLGARLFTTGEDVIFLTQAAKRAAAEAHEMMRKG